MASSASVGTSASTSAGKARSFYSDFGRTIQSLEADIDAAQSTRDLDPVLRSISAARTQLTQATEILPAHDRQLHEKNLSKLTQRLTARRQALQPAKGGFTFRRTPKAAPTASSDLASSSTSARAKPVASSPPTAPRSASPSIAPPSKTTYLSIDTRRHRYISSRSLSPSSSTTGAARPQHDLHITDLEDCIIDLRCAPGQDGGSGALELGALQIRGVRRCIILTGQVKGSVMVHDISDSWLLVEKCRQFRMHTSSATLVSLATTGSIATIEGCRDLRFTTGVPHSLAAPHSAKTEGKTELQVQDFDSLLSSSHLKVGGGGGTASEPSKNWRIVDESTIEVGVQLLHASLQGLAGSDEKAVETKGIAAIFEGLSIPT
ncbi:uncharacterized protein PFL1_04198 [Pseudozyma flocculosa PF-1]|uniref:C-CAP/cofactor C-like domain-containing protein n=2 Tax=Pseudozyma flocculosa TaxID=84751 RepID=A0A5C3EUX1_9BASI|nr:uncharacterized protein PFL1_04198 [Pseudozyma flocculosa PF-1]EPQ28371.1 hypothetical protein PFL1_04198 [Pseudozyma flocculosa PF-1]SPO35525.1 uncharacterized protein PSFLO_00996 [Pseudozyma flocculosa]